MQTEETMVRALYNDRPTPAVNSGTLVTGPDQPRATAPVDGADPGRALYGHRAVEQAVDARASDLFETLGATDGQRLEIRNTFVSIAKAGVPADIVADLAEGFIDGEVAAARAESPEAYAAALETRVAKANQELRADLAERYGVKEAEDLIQRTQRYVNATPTLSKILGKHGLGSQPDLFERIVAHVFINGLGR